MTETYWKHRFVQALLTVIHRKTGLAHQRCFDLARLEADAFWRHFNSYESPEAAADQAFVQMCAS